MNLRSSLIRLAYGKPELRESLLPLLREAAADFGPAEWDLLEKIYDGTTLSSADRQMAKELTRQKLLEFDSEDPGHPWGLSAQGMNLLRKPRPTFQDPRKKISGQIAEALASVLSGMGIDYDKPQISSDFRTIWGGYKSQNLPKESYEVEEGEYDRLVARETSDFKRRLGPALNPFKSQISRLRVNDGEKSWMYVHIELR